MKVLKYKVGGVEIEVSPSEEDCEWVKALFERNANPFKALHDIGFVTDEMNQT